MREKSYSFSTINEVVDLLLSFENSTIKTHFLVSQIYVKVGLGNEALNHLKNVKFSVLTGELDASKPDIAKLNTAIDLCRNAVKNNSKSQIIANKMYDDFCL